ncbi:MAG: tetratricopeptide repeat protein, partial [Myxococcota bacterium]
AAARDLAAAHPDDPTALRIAGRVLAAAGAVDEAAQVYDRAITRYPGDWRTWVGRATDAPEDRRAQAWRDAVAHGAPPRFLERAWRVIPVGLYWLDAAATRDARFSANLGAFLETRGDPETAVLAYEQAYLIDPTEVPHPGYARVLLALGRNEEAARFVAQALAVRPDDARLLSQQAEILEAQGRFADASTIWLEVGVAHPVAVVRAMRATEQADGAAAAVRLADRLALTRPLDGSAVLERARLHRDLGEFGACAVDVERSGTLTHKQLGARARSLLDACKR